MAQEGAGVVLLVVKRQVVAECKGLGASLVEAVMVVVGNGVQAR